MVKMGIKMILYLYFKIRKTDLFSFSGYIYIYIFIKFILISWLPKLNILKFCNVLFHFIRLFFILLYTLFQF